MSRPESQGKLANWWTISRPAALPKLLLPLGFGLALAHSGGARLELSALLNLFALAICAQLAIVYSNDLADFGADREQLKRDPHAAHKRLYARGLIQKSTLTIAAGLCFAACLTLGWHMDGGRWVLFSLTALSVVSVLAYGFPPLRLNYRGGGELLEALGTGLLLPLIALAHFGVALDSLPLLPLLISFLLALSGALGSGLSHPESDRLSAKRTVAVIWSTAFAARSSLHLLQLAVLGVFTQAGNGRALLLAPALFATALLWPAARAMRDGELRLFKKWQKLILLVLWLSLWGT